MSNPPGDLQLRCSCGTVRGTVRNVSPKTGTRCICYCDDCQTYARSLAVAAPILDEHGGTDILQVSQACIAFTDGDEHVACLTLRPGGLLRWYADCCRTPLCNTPANPQLAVAGLVHNCLGPAVDGRLREALTGEVRAGVFGRFACGDRETLAAYDGAPLTLILRTLGRLLRWRLRGDHRRSPFFDPASLAPRVRPRVLSPEELQTARGDSG